MMGQQFYQKTDVATLEPSQEVILKGILPSKNLKNLSLWLYSQSPAKFEYGIKYGRKSLKYPEQIEADSLIPFIATFSEAKEELNPRFSLSLYLKNLSDEKVKVNFSFCCYLIQK